MTTVFPLIRNTADGHRQHTDHDHSFAAEMEYGRWTQWTHGSNLTYHDHSLFAAGTEQAKMESDRQADRITFATH